MVRRISRQRDRFRKILNILDKEKATFQKLHAEVGCGRITLSNDLKLLVRRDIIKKYEDLKDARIKWYEKIVVGPEDRVRAEKGKYASMDFIENLKNPIYGYKSSPDGKKTVSGFISPVDEPQRESAQKKVNELVDKIGVFGMLRIVSGRLRPGQQIAVVLTVKG